VRHSLSWVGGQSEPANPAAAAARSWSSKRKVSSQTSSTRGTRRSKTPERHLVREPPPPSLTLRFAAQFVDGSSFEFEAPPPSKLLQAQLCRRKVKNSNASSVSARYSRLYHEPESIHRQILILANFAGNTIRVLGLPGNLVRDLLTFQTWRVNWKEQLRRAQDCSSAGCTGRTPSPTPPLRLSGQRRGTGPPLRPLLVFLQIRKTIIIRPTRSALLK